MALRFIAASNQYLYSAISVANRVPMTMMAWVKRSTANCLSAPVCIGDIHQTDHFQTIQLRDGGVRGLAFNGTAQAWYDIAGDTTTYHQFVAVFVADVNTNHGHAYIYWDGELVSTSSEWSIVGIDIDQIRIGETVSDTYSDLMNGYVEHIAVWDVALTGDEISSLYAKSVNPMDVQPTHLLTYTPLKTDLVDDSGKITWTPVNLSSPSYEESGVTYPDQEGLATWPDFDCDVYENFEDASLAAGLSLTTPGNWTIPSANYPWDGSNSGRLDISGTSGAYISYTGTYNNISFGFAVRTPVIDQWTLLYLASIHSNNTGYQLRICLSRLTDGTSYNVRFISEGGDQNHEVLSNTLYWVTVQFNRNGIIYYQVYDSSHTKVVDSSIPAGNDYQLDWIEIGADSLGDKTGYVYYDALVVDKTDATFPLLGWSTTGGTPPEPTPDLGSKLVMVLRG